MVSCNTTNRHIFRDAFIVPTEEPELFGEENAAESGVRGQRDCAGLAVSLQVFITILYLKMYSHALLYFEEANKLAIKSLMWG